MVKFLVLILWLLIAPISFALTLHLLPPFSPEALKGVYSGATLFYIIVSVILFEELK